MEFEFVLIAEGSNSTASKSTKLKLKILLFFLRHKTFSNFPYMFLNPNIFFSNLRYNCSNLLDMRNLQEQVKNYSVTKKLFWPFTGWIDCPSDLNNFTNSWPSTSNFKSFSGSLEQFFLTVGQNNFDPNSYGRKIEWLILLLMRSESMGSGINNDPYGH